MKAYFASFVVGLLVGCLYAALRVRSPAPPLVALTGLLGILAGESAWPRAAKLIGEISTRLVGK